MARPTTDEAHRLANALDLIALALDAEQAAQLLLLRTIRAENDRRELRIIRRAIATLKAIGQAEHDAVTALLQAKDPK